jgi:hypothetical protein
MEYYLAIKRNETLIHTIQMNFETMLSERKQSQYTTGAGSTSSKTK